MPVLVLVSGALLPLLVSGALLLLVSGALVLLLAFARGRVHVCLRVGRV